MRLRVRTTGGILGADRLVEVDDTRVIVNEAGRPRRHTDLEPHAATELAEMAGRVVATGFDVAADAAKEAVDAAYTDIEIVDRDVEHRLRLPSGVDAPAEVWDLLDTVEQITDAAAASDGPSTSR